MSDKLKEHPLSNTMNINSNSMNRTMNTRSPSMIPQTYQNFPYQNFNLNMHNLLIDQPDFSLNGFDISNTEFISSKSVFNNGFLSPRSSFNLKESFHISTINNKIEEFEATEIKHINNLKESSNENTYFSSNINSNKNNLLLNSMYSLYEGRSNFSLFMKACTPYIFKRNQSDNVKIFLF